MTCSLHVGFFEDDRDLLEAVRECRARGMPILDVVSPFPVHGLDEALGIRPSRLPWVTLIARGTCLSAMTSPTVARTGTRSLRPVAGSVEKVGSSVPWARFG